MSGLIYKKILAVMADIDFIAKDRKNEKQNYRFRGIDDVYAAMHPLLVKHGIFTALEVLSETRSEKASNSGGVLLYSILKIRYDFFAEDGSKVSCTVVGEGMDSGDKATNKAMSVAHKYCFLQTFAIPTEEDKDSENDSPNLKTEHKITGVTKASPEVSKQDCAHQWMTSKFNQAEEYCVKCKSKRLKGVA